MTELTREKLNKILEEHKHWINEVGKAVEVTDFNKDRWRECAKSIHFFISRQEAIDY